MWFKKNNIKTYPPVKTSGGDKISGTGWWTDNELTVNNNLSYICSTYFLAVSGIINNSGTLEDPSTTGK